MDIRPQDLGMRRNVALIRLRAAISSSGASGNTGVHMGLMTAQDTNPHKRLGLLERFWTRESGLDEPSAISAMEGMRNTKYGIMGGLIGGGCGFLGPAIGMYASHQYELCMLFATGWGTMLGLGLTLPGTMFRKWNTKMVRVSEIDALLPLIPEEDTLEQSYLKLVRDAVRQDIPKATERDLRAAIHALGEAIDHLPNIMIPAQDVEELHHAATLTLARAEEESDPVVVASLLRRAEAQEQSARSVEQASLLVRRTTALREELAAQTEALRTGLAASYTGAVSIANVSHLAAAVRNVANEASSVAAARHEIDSTVSSVIPPSVADAIPVRAGRG